MSIVLSFSILFQGLNLHVSDMLELQVMLEHLQEHQSSFGDDVFTFFDKHYGFLQAEHEEEDHKGSGKHENLPFKHKVCQFNMGTLIHISAHPEKGTDPVAIQSSRNYFYLDNYSFLDQTDIFQPPQFL